MDAAERQQRALDLGRRLIDGIVAHDWQAITDCFEPDARLRAVVPKESPFRDRVGAEEAAEQLRRWFGDADVTELMSSTIEPMEDRVRVAYRIHEHEPDGWYVVEQQAYLTAGAHGIAFMNLVCSGFRPVRE
jgi:hypothetical protein